MNTEHMTPRQLRRALGRAKRREAHAVKRCQDNPTPANYRLVYKAGHRADVLDLASGCAVAPNPKPWSMKPGVVIGVLRASFGIGLPFAKQVQRQRRAVKRAREEFYSANEYHRRYSTRDVENRLAPGESKAGLSEVEQRLHKLEAVMRKEEDALDVRRVRHSGVQLSHETTHQGPNRRRARP